MSTDSILFIIFILAVSTLLFTWYIRSYNLSNILSSSSVIVTAAIMMLVFFIDIISNIILIPTKVFSQPVLDAIILILALTPLIYLWVRRQIKHVAAITDNIIDGIIVIDDKGNVNYFNPAAEKIFGYSAYEVLGKNINILMPESYHKEHDIYINDYMQTGIPKVIGIGREVYGKRKDGRIFPMYLAVNQVKSENQVSFVGIIQDISWKKEEEEKIKNSEKGLSEAQRIAHMGNWDWNIVTNKLHWSDEIYRIFGLPPQEFDAAYDAFLAMVHPDDRSLVIHAINEAIYDHKPYNIEHRIILSDGVIKIINQQGEVTYDENNKPVKMIGTVLDITERKLLEEKLKKSEARLAEAQDIANIGSYEFNVMTDPPSFDYWSDHMYRIFGYLPGEIAPSIEFFGSALHPDERERFAKDYEKALSEGEPDEYEYKIIRRDGTERIIRIKTEVLRGGDDKPTKFCGVIQDITEQKEIEKVLQTGQAIYSEIFNNSPDAIFLWDVMPDERFRIVMVNPTNYNLTGFTPEKAFGRMLDELIPPELYLPVKQNYLACIKAGKQTEYNENAVINGSNYVFHTTLTPIKNGHGEVVRILGISRDITERSRAEEELRKAKNEAEFANRAKTNFLAVMSHEIRTPMNAIIGMADLLSETQPTKEQEEYIQIFQKSGEHLLSLINDILDLSKIESGHMDIEDTDFNLKKVAQKAVDIMEVKAKTKKIKLEFEIAEDVPVSLQGDPNRLNQILLNLLGNAIKFTHRGRISVNIKKLSEGDDKVELLFEVKDTGIGIPANKVESIFNIFTQVDSSTTREYGGTGLGLTISKKLAELMGGRIWVESTIGKGSSFFFTIKIKRSAQPAASEVITVLPVGLKQDEHHHGKKGKKLLVVDDSEDNRQLIMLYLKKLPYHLDIAENGEEAIEKYKNKKYDLILMDIQMPVMDGYRATAIIRDLEHEHEQEPIPVIALTAHAFKEDEEKSIKAGCTGHLTKPIKKATLIETIEKYTD